MKTHGLVLIAAMLLGRSLLLGSEIEAPALTLRIEDAATRKPIVGVRVYRFFQTVRVRHFLGIKGIPSPESKFEFRVAEHYLTDGEGEVCMPSRRFSARLYEQGVSDMLYINLTASSQTGDLADAQAFARNEWKLTSDPHFLRSIVQSDQKWSAVMLYLEASRFENVSRFDGAYAWFSLKRIGDRVVVRLASAKDGKIDGRLSEVSFLK